MKWDVQATEEYERMLSKIGDEKTVHGIANMAIYEAAAIVADTIKSSISSLSAVSDQENLWNWRKGKKGQLSVSQKQGLIDGLGVAKFKVTNGYINTKIGFNGYNSVRTKKYPNGQPNTLIARMVEGGGSTFEAQPFVAKSVAACRQSAIAAMNVVIDREIEALTK